MVTCPPAIRIEYARESEQMDFDHADAAPAQELNQIIWASVKGSVPMPARRGFSAGQDGKSDADD